MSAQGWRAAAWLVLALGLAIAGAFEFSGRLPLQTNLLALLPPTERNPLAERAVTRLADAAGNRAVFLVSLQSAENAPDAARYFAAQLAETQVFRRVTADIPPFDPRQITGFYQGARFNLLSDADRQTLSNGSADLLDRLQRKLYAPFRFGLSLSPADDPFGFTDAWLSSLPLKNLRLEAENNLLVVRDAGRLWVFVAAELPGSAYDSAVQRRTIDAVANAESALHHAYRGQDPQVLRVGTVFYAAAARASAESEVDLIGAGSLLGMLLLLYLVFRSLRPLALGLLSVGFGILAAVVVTVKVFGELHLIALVFGASLIGEAIDYAIQYFAAHLGAGAAWEPMAGLRRIAPGLTVALATSLLGYCALMLAPFPALSQIALFALVGLSAAWLTVFLLLPWLLKRPSRRDPEMAVAWPQAFLRWWQANASRKICLMLCVVLLCAAVPGWFSLTANDDVRLLISRPPGLQYQEERISRLTGFTSGGPFFLVEGATSNEVLVNEERLATRLGKLVEAQAIGGFQSLAAFVPSAERQAQNRALWQAKVFGDEIGLRQLLAQSELRDDAADRLIGEFKASASSLLRLEDWLQLPLSTPFRHLWFGATDRGFASVVPIQGARAAEQLESAADGLPGVTLVDKAGSVSRLFHAYRQWGALWLLGALVLVYGVLCLRYGVRQAVVMVSPTLLAIALDMGVLGYLGSSLTLFNLMGLMLVLGVGVNYAVFLREGGVRAAATLAGVLLSAGTTLLSFGLLAFSSMPALSGFGLTLLLGIGFSVLLAPLVLTFAPGARA